MGWFFGGGSEDNATSGTSTSSFDPENLTSDSSFGSFDSGSDGFGGGSTGLDFGTGVGSQSKDSELQSFLMMEQQKAQMQAMIHKMNETCWELCVGSPGSRLDSRTETCISNCVDRFIDSSLFITNRFAQLLSKSGGGM